MVALNESSIFEAIIRRIETNDPVQGGEPNPATGQSPPNIALMQLANRTRWLLDELSSMYTNAEIDSAISSAFAVLTATEILTRLKTVDGAGSGSDSDLVDGLHASAFWQAADAPFLAAGDGYQVLPSGIILQWGAASGTSATFPIAFPSVVFNVVISDRDSTEAQTFNVTTRTRFGFDFTSTALPWSAFYFAVGN